MSEKSETAAQLFARLTPRPCLQEVESRLFCQNEVKVVEILGEEGSGKTELLLHLMINTIIPKTWHGLEIGGIGSSVLYIDTDYKFPMLRFISLIEQRLLAYQNHHEISSASDSEEFVKFSLQNFYKMNCSSTLQLIETLQSLQSFFCDNPDTILLAIDNISSFYWTEILNDGKQETYKNHKLLGTILHDLVEKYGLNIVFTRNMFSDQATLSFNKLDSFPKLVKSRYGVKRHSKGDSNYFSRVGTGSPGVEFKITADGILFS